MGRERGTTGAVAVLLAAFALGCAPPSPEADDRSPVIYGADDRQEFYQIRDAKMRRRVEDATAALFAGTEHLSQRPSGRYVVRAPAYARRYDLCDAPGDRPRFADQPAAADCSGVLIAPQVVATAGHCTAPQCEALLVVFDFHYEAPRRLASIDPEDVYRCQRILARSHDTEGADFALIELDRPVEGRTPAPVLPRTASLSDQQELALAGSPGGLPGKYADRGRVRNLQVGGDRYFQAELDAFGGSSGSAVYDEAGRVVGVLARGGTDYTEDRSCRRPRTVAPGEARSVEEVTHAAPLVDALCATRPVAGLCPGRLGPCDVCVDDRDCQANGRCAPGGIDGSFRCRFPCPDSAACPWGHRCEGGECAPAPSSDTERCEGRSVWRHDVCGQPLYQVRECHLGEICRAGACRALSAGDGCRDPIPLPAVDAVYDDSFLGHTRNFEDNCLGRGPDAVYRFELAHPRRVHASVLAGTAKLRLRDADCATRASGCSDAQHALSETLAPGRYHLVIQSERRVPRPHAFRFALRFEALPPKLCDGSASEAWSPPPGMKSTSTAGDCPNESDAPAAQAPRRQDAAPGLGCAHAAGREQAHPMTWLLGCLFAGLIRRRAPSRT